MKGITVLLTILFLSLGVSAEQWKVTFVTPDIVRVQYSVSDELTGNNTGVCVYTPTAVETRSCVIGPLETVASQHLSVSYNKRTGMFVFNDVLTQEALLSAKVSAEGLVYQEKITYDENSAHVEETANGKVTVRDILRRDTTGVSNRYVVSCVAPDEKAIYGLGAQMEDYMNLKGKTVYLTQHNLKVHIPVLVSPKGYGLLFDAGCAMKYSSPLPASPGGGEQNHSYSMQMEGAKELDFYFIYSPLPTSPNPSQGGGIFNSLAGSNSCKKNKGQSTSKISSPRGGREGASGALGVVAGYRYLTGNVSMMPRYVFGYTQSKERYTSSADLINTLKEYRRRHVPIDMIVQDWNYWPQGWGYMKMDTKYYPDPKALADSIHAMNAKLMVSIWPNPQWCPEADDFKARGMMLPNDVYDVFNPEARKHYWKYANDEFFSRGFDAWWCDSSEPLDGDWNSPPAPEGGVPYSWNSHERRWHLNKNILSESLGLERSSLYSFYHSMGIYENQRQQNILNISSPRGGREGARVVNLTRSSFAGQQRYGTIVWNGDTHASWQSFRQQIPSGLNYMATGNPYWTVDVGSFFTRNDGRRWFYTGEFPEGVNSDAYKEYYVRMFQWATFLPMLRSHGSDTPREIWRFETSPNPSEGGGHGPYYDAILKMINLRYQHIPYIYSIAAMQSNIISSPLTGRSGGVLMARPLAFDYPEDEAVLDLKDEYMFGDFLVCPVTHPLSETTIRKVYLPKGATWIDYWTGKEYNGSQWLNYDLLNQQDSLTNTPPSGVEGLPLFVKKGSIIPTTEVAEYTAAQVGKPVTINIYPGNDASFTLYEDEGDNYNYEKGAYSIIPMMWDEAKHTLTIGSRTGSFDGMQTSRTFIVKTPTSSKTIKYKGKEIRIKLKK